MINYYQPYLTPFLRRKTYRLPHGVHRHYFLSFEDALWVFLKQTHVARGSVILVPDFYCLDVTINIESHGYRVVFYPLDDHFQIPESKLEGYIKKYHPGVLIIFHASGIQSGITHAISRITTRHKNLYIIEDAVQRLVDPESVTLTTPNHILIDSLRKVSPLPGSFLYRKTGRPAFVADPAHHEWQYRLSVQILYRYFRILNVLGTLLRSPEIIVYAHETILRKHDDLVGNSTGGYAGSSLVPRVHEHIDFAKIQALKIRQYDLYRKGLSFLFRTTPFWYRIRIPLGSRGLLHAFPIGFRHKKLLIGMKFVQAKLHARGIPVWFKFTDSGWSRTRGILFLPLGFHMSNADIKRIARTLNTVSSSL